MLGMNLSGCIFVLSKTRCAVSLQDDEDRRKADMPKARGLVKDTIDPRLRKSVAK